MNDESKTANAQGVRSTEWLGMPSAELDTLLTTAEKLAEDLERDNRYGAEADGWRVRKLIEIVKACIPNAGDKLHSGREEASNE